MVSVSLVSFCGRIVGNGSIGLDLRTPDVTRIVAVHFGSKDSPNMFDVLILELSLSKENE